MKIDLNENWIYNYHYDQLPDGDTVRIPHSVSLTPLHYFDESVYQTVSGYINYFDAPKEWKGKRIFVNFEGVAHEATVYLNGLLLGTHSCGYTAFSYEITDYINLGSVNELKVRVDSRESLNIPPFGFVIDYKKALLKMSLSVPLRQDPSSLTLLSTAVTRRSRSALLSWRRIPVTNLQGSRAVRATVL